MFEILREATLWLLGFADSDWAALVLVITTFLESIFSPIPPDPLLISMGIRNPDMAVWFSMLAMVSSIAGALVGHWLGGRFGRPLLYKLVSGNRAVAAEKMFDKHGVWAIIVAAITPVPYKVFAILAGVLGFDRKRFIVASVIGRGVRFLALGSLLFVYGEAIGNSLEKHFETVTIASAAALVLAILVIAIITKLSRTRKNTI